MEPYTVTLQVQGASQADAENRTVANLEYAKAMREGGYDFYLESDEPEAPAPAEPFGGLESDAAFREQEGENVAVHAEEAEAEEEAEEEADVEAVELEPGESVEVSAADVDEDAVLEAELAEIEDNAATEEDEGGESA